MSGRKLRALLTIWVVLSMLLIVNLSESQVNSQVGVGGAFTVDAVSPVAVVDLAVIEKGRDYLTLGWTAPGDDGNQGTATGYDIRWSQSRIITEGEWNAARTVGGELVPKPSGSTETLIVVGLSPATTYWFALRTSDDAHNWSELSNGTKCITLGANLTVQVRLQGEERPVEGYEVPFTMKLYNQPVTTANIITLAPLDMFSTEQGDITIIEKNVSTRTINLSITGLPLGIYRATLHSSHCLVNYKTGIIITEGETTIDMGALLEGDALDITKGSLTIDISDFTVFAKAFEATASDVHWDANADFDRNGGVDILDFSLLYTNYGKTSPRFVGL